MHSFLSPSNNPLTGYTTLSSCHIYLCPSADRHLGSFHFWSVMNNTATNIRVRVFIGTSVFISLSFIPMSKTAGSSGNSSLKLLC